ncbi:MAG TPA: hypothetical protein VFV72_13555 [Candidatus Limnocylindrales bacterium]|nr:hypothetical protein [Candidatus Limnocylindrales bacterium]
MSDEVLQRIAGWQAAGLIDAATAERLRSAELTTPAEPPGPDSETARPGVLASFFGPSVSIVEAFSYVGGAFLLGSWSALIVRLSGEAASESSREWIIVAGIAIAAAAFFVLGWILDGRSPRMSRAAGVMFLLSALSIWGGAYANAEIFLDGSIVAVVGAGAGLVAALAFRKLHPSLLTQLAMLATLTGLVSALLGLLDELLYPEASLPLGTYVERGLPSALVAAAAWIGCAVVIGVIAVAESRSDDPAAARRAALTRFWAGVTAVSGVAYSLMQTNFDETGAHRVIEPWIADLAVLIVAAVLLERAFRREAASYVLAAALGVIIALTDFNATYFAPSSGAEVALLVEGLLLIAIAFAAERISRRVTGRRPPAFPPPTEPTEPTEPIVDPEALSA